MPRSAPIARRQKQQQRGNANARGYNWAWRKYRASYLKRHPLCIECEAKDKVTAATVVDHIVPHRGNKRLFDDPNNHQPLCDRCHNSKSAKERG